MTGYPGRWLFITAETAVAFAGTVGAVQLVSGSFTPPVSDLDALGLNSWVLPGIWLFASVGLPAGAAAWLAWRRSPSTPKAVLLASGLLLLELGVQVPFVGPSVLQAVMGTVAVGLAATAVAAGRRGWGDPVSASRPIRHQESKA